MLAPNSQNPLLSGPILPTLMRLSLPNMGAMVATSLVAIAETSYVGVLGTSALAGLALVFPFVMLQQMMSGGAMGGGVSSSIARALGANDVARANSLALHASFIGLSAGVVMALIIFFLGPAIFAALGGRDAALADAIAYARAAGLLDLNIAKSPERDGQNTTSSSLVSGNLLSINSALSEATAARIASQERFASASRAPTLSLPEVQNNGTVQALVRERAMLAAQYADMGQRRQERFPEMVQTKARIDAIDRQIKQTGQTVIDALRENLDYAKRREAMLRSQLDSLRSEALTEQERSVQYNLLRREADTNRSLYDMLLERYREISTVAGVIAANIVMLDSAEVPGGPVAPQPLINMLVALVIGLGIAVALAYLRETFDDAVRAPEEIEEKLNTQFLGAIPKLAEDDDPFDQLEERTSPISESYLALRSVLSFSTSEGLPKVLLCTSSLPGEGKSTSSYALARSFGAIGKKTLLLDGDLRKPTVHYLFDLPREPGFSEIIVGDKQISEVVHSVDQPNLDVLTCGTMPPNPAELFSGDHAAVAVDRLAELYDVIVIDGPPVMGLADAPLLASIADGTLLVVEAGRGYRGQAKVAIRRLRANSARIVGAVLTKFDARQSGYGYAYEYNYAYTYKYGHDTKPKSFWFWSRPQK